MFEIWIDSDGYYTEQFDASASTVQVNTMPTDISSARQLLAYKYNPETRLLEKDENRLADIQQEALSPVKIPSEAERLADLEAAFLELANMIVGGE